MYDASRFFAAIWGREKGVAEIRTVDPVSQWFFYWPSEEAELLSAIDRMTPTNNIFFGVALRKGRSGKAEDVGELPWIWADVDKKRGATFSSILSASIPTPQIVVDSGNGWHLYWKMAMPVSHIMAQELMDSLAVRLGGDSVFDPSRILRVPYTFNRKDPDNLHPVRILRMKGLGRGWRIGDFDRTRIEHSISRHVRVATGMKGTRSEDLFKVALIGISLELPDEEIYKLMLEHPAGEKLLEMRTKDRRKRWVKLTIDKARKIHSEK